VPLRPLAHERGAHANRRCAELEAVLERADEAGAFAGLDTICLRRSAAEEIVGSGFRVTACLDRDGVFGRAGAWTYYVYWF
jgi:hypothetical protein